VHLFLQRHSQGGRNARIQPSKVQCGLRKDLYCNLRL